MNKKMICLVLSLAMLLVSVTAFAAPSKTTNDLTAVLGATDASGVTMQPATLTEAETAVLNAIGEIAKAGPVVAYFPADIQSQIAALLPAGFDSNTLVMNEFIALTVSGYDSNFGDLDSTFTFATQYPDGTVLVAMLGIVDGGNVTWMPVRATVANGVVTVHFTKAALEAANGRETVLAILSGDAAK